MMIMVYYVDLTMMMLYNRNCDRHRHLLLKYLRGSGRSRLIIRQLSQKQRPRQDDRMVNRFMYGRRSRQLYLQRYVPTLSQGLLHTSSTYNP